MPAVHPCPSNTLAPRPSPTPLLFAHAPEVTQSVAAAAHGLILHRASSVKLHVVAVYADQAAWAALFAPLVAKGGPGQRALKMQLAGSCLAAPRPQVGWA